MSPIIYSKADHRRRMTLDEIEMLEDTNVYRRYLEDSREEIDDPGFDPEPYRAGLEARCANVYEYELDLARDAYRAAYDYLTGEDPHFMTFEQLTVSELHRLTRHVERAAERASRV